MMNIEPKITAIVVCYGSDAILLETIDSVLIQTQDAIELIISDDGSGKFSKEFVEKFIEEKKHENVVAVSVHAYEENVGTVRNINRALKEARGQYIKMIGGDDAFYDENVFADQIKFLEENRQYLLVTGLSEQCDEHMQHVDDVRTEQTNRALEKIYSMPPREAFAFYQVKGYSPFVTQAICFKKEFFEKYGYFDEDFVLMEDAPTGARMILEGIPVGVLQKFSVKHRMNVGISATDDFFSGKKTKYYEDRITYCKKYMVPNTEILGKRRVQMGYGISCFRLEMALANKDKRSFFTKGFIALKYIYPIFLYIIMGSEKAKKAIKTMLSAK